MTATPIVSVVMPVYNGERFVGEAVESVLDQTFTDFELITVDDGSRDRSREILAGYAARDPRVRVHLMPRNGGAIAARNEGTRLANAPLVAVMDADDISLPDRLMKQVRYLNEHPDVGVVGTFVQLVDSSGTRSIVKTYPSDPALMAWALPFFNSLAHPSVMMRREVLVTANGYAPDCKGGAEDYDLFSRASRRTKLANVPEVLLLYRKWEGNMTRTAWESQEQDATRIASEAAAALLGEGISDELARQFRGLATGNYPRTAADIRMVGTGISRLYGAFARQPWLTDADRRLVARDAGIKLWLLASVASVKWPPLAASLAFSAFSISPGSLPGFIAKAARRASDRQN